VIMVGRRTAQSISAFPLRTRISRSCLDVE
jgi:hypothetical protein